MRRKEELKSHPSGKRGRDCVQGMDGVQGMDAREDSSVSKTDETQNLGRLVSEKRRRERGLIEEEG